MISFTIHIEKQRYKNFIDAHPDAHLFQSYEWGELKSQTGWEMETFGLEKNGELIAVALILFKHIPIVNKKIAYAPRGFVFDYEDTHLAERFTNDLKEYLQTQNVFMFRFDPDILFRERDLDGNIIDNGIDNKQMIQTFKQMGYIHRGKELNYGGFQPRFTFRLDLMCGENDLFGRFLKSTQYKIKYAERRGIEIVEGNRQDLALFDKLNDLTAERQQFTMRPLSYFEKMYDFFEPSGQIKLFFAKCNVNKAVSYIDDQLIKKEQEQLMIYQKLQKMKSEQRITKLRESLKDISEQIDRLRQEKQALMKRMETKPDGIILSAALWLKQGNKAWYLYSGSHNILRNYMANYILQWHMIRYSKAAGCHIYDFYGMSGDLSPDNPLYGIYQFKRSFNPQFTEFVGEFDLVLSPFHYHLFTKALPIRKWYRSKRLAVKEHLESLFKRQEYEEHIGIDTTSSR